MSVYSVTLSLAQAQEKDKADLLSRAKIILTEDIETKQQRMISGRKWIRETERYIASENAGDMPAPIVITILVKNFSSQEYAEAYALVLKIKGEVDDSDDPIELSDEIIG